MINTSKLKKYIIAIFFSVTFFYSASALKAEIKVVTTIQPLHSLVANVMDGSGDLGLILEGSASPHNFSLKPSHARMLEKADVIFWFGEDLEIVPRKVSKNNFDQSKDNIFYETE
ncbi:MAG: metal ABC transporter solute-binding protein, Zn/Mn family [Rhodospirillales bacterium]